MASFPYFWKMRKLLPFVAVLFLIRCTAPTEKVNDKIITEDVVVRDSFQLLCQYWELQDADNPTSKDIGFNENGIDYQSGINFSVDSTLLENPKGKMSYGTFSLSDNVVNANYDKGRKANYKILKLTDDELVLKREEKGQTSKLFYKSTNTYWPVAKENPFSKTNYQWVVKPQKSETPEEIKNRAKECVQFYSYYFKGFATGKAKKITFNNLPNCFRWYQGGIFIVKEEALDIRWIDCFYSPDQAYTARQLLEDAIMKKYDWDTTQTNWVKQTSLVLQQIHDGM